MFFPCLFIYPVVIDRHAASITLGVVRSSAVDCFNFSTTSPLLSFKRSTLFFTRPLIVLVRNYHPHRRQSSTPSSRFSFLHLHSHVLSMSLNQEAVREMREIQDSRFLHKASDIEKDASPSASRVASEMALIVLTRSRNSFALRLSIATTTSLRLARFNHNDTQARACDASTHLSSRHSLHQMHRVMPDPVHLLYFSIATGGMALISSNKRITCTMTSFLSPNASTSC